MNKLTILLALSVLFVGITGFPSTVTNETIIARKDSQECKKNGTYCSSRQDFFSGDDCPGSPSRFLVHCALWGHYSTYQECYSGPCIEGEDKNGSDDKCAPS
ncbi:uncharacterized protein LY89DRAFT_722966 [Mollisia scopiformis]|uniref:Secreted protein n=1 Tax=Mollisia scopiformis TaxID=149040 RepID=A0A194WT19_MOLSC|nr:uncharacterized protein LY89DRAFT_722966 [Mollisia scopiformis]KUJ11105.1 hypothetical protein LY89DRAFT_722966 [Mollisia scopiformis]